MATTDTTEVTFYFEVGYNRKYIVPYIKYIRAITSWGLKESKEFVDTMLDNPYDGVIHHFRDRELGYLVRSMYEYQRYGDDKLPISIRITNVI